VRIIAEGIRKAAEDHKKRKNIPERTELTRALLDIKKMSMMKP